MKRLIKFLLPILLILVAGCEDNASDSPENVTVSIKYYHPNTETTEGVEYYSQSASISWGSGSTTLPGRNEYFSITVPNGAKLSASYSRYYKSYKDTLLDRKADYEKTAVASSGLKWEL